MFQLSSDSADGLYKELCYKFKGVAVEEASRNGKVLTIPYPSMITLHDPQRRVLHNPSRDANPFFHLMESIWMMAGRNDAEWLGQFSSNIGQYAEDDGYFNAAYGHRWRHHFGFDQLQTLCKQIKEDPYSRQHVLQIWETQDLLAKVKDKACNTQIMFRVEARRQRLDMLVVNRSNDAIWGALGANIVHMTMLHELVALATGIQLGTYRVVSNNLHVYEMHWDMITFKATAEEWYARTRDACCTALHDQEIHLEDWLQDCETFCQYGPLGSYNYPWFNNVAAPMMRGYTEKNYEKRVELLGAVQDPNWQTAALNWVKRRLK